MTTPPDFVLTVRGNAYQRGVTHGELARDKIRAGVAHYGRMWEHGTDRSRVELLDLAGEFGPVIADYDDTIYRELEGIAAGAKMPLAEVLMLNARYEIMMVAFFGGKGAQAGVARGECTSFAAQPEATTDGHTYVAQNWDTTTETSDRVVLLEIITDDGPNIVTHCEAGFAAHKGLNSAGLGLCVNCIGCQHDAFATKVPVWVMARAVLNCTTIDQAQQALLRARRTASINFTIGSAAGQVAALEITPVDIERIDPIEGRLAHANVICGLDESRGLTDTLADRFPVFCDRSRRAHELIDGAAVNAIAFEHILKDRANAPEAICRHIEDQPPDAPQGLCMHTVTSIIMDLTDRTIQLTDGPPDRNQYTRYNFDSLGKNSA